MTVFDFVMLSSRTHCYLNCLLTKDLFAFYLFLKSTYISRISLFLAFEFKVTFV